MYGDGNLSGSPDSWCQPAIWTQLKGHIPIPLFSTNKSANFSVLESRPPPIWSLLECMAMGTFLDLLTHDVSLQYQLSWKSTFPIHTNYCQVYNSPSSSLNGNVEIHSYKAVQCTGIQPSTSIWPCFNGDIIPAFVSVTPIWLLWDLKAFSPTLWEGVQKTDFFKNKFRTSIT